MLEALFLRLRTPSFAAVQGCWSARVAKTLLLPTSGVCRDLETPSTLFPFIHEGFRGLFLHIWTGKASVLSMSALLVPSASWGLANKGGPCLLTHCPALGVDAVLEP